MTGSNARPYVYIERGRALVTSAQRVSDILVDRVVTGSREGLAAALHDLEDHVAFIRAQADDKLTEEGYERGAVTPNGADAGT